MNPSDKRAISIAFAGQEMLLDGSGALYWPSQHTLLVSDLHLEKGSFLAQFGSALPQYDSRDTLLKLQQVIARYEPLRIVCLGDSFHDRKAISRLPAEDRHMLADMVKAHEWVWILGNHDASLEGAFPGATRASEEVKGICLTHEPVPRAPAQIIGHYHPKLRIHLGGQRLSGKCFLVGRYMLVMPAFGSYTGGLDCGHATILSLSPQPFTRYFLYRGRIWKV